MLDKEQIDNWRDGDLHPDVEAALEVSRRWRKGLPTDRFTDGARGMIAVARGIERMSAAILRHMDEDARRGADAMEPTRDPMRDIE
jgi:hypothetical protein